MCVLDANRNEKTVWYLSSERTRQRRGLSRRVVRIMGVRQSQGSAKHFHYMGKQDRNSEMGEEGEYVKGVITTTSVRQTE